MLQLFLTQLRLCLDMQGNQCNRFCGRKTTTTDFVEERQQPQTHFAFSTFYNFYSSLNKTIFTCCMRQCAVLNTTCSIKHNLGCMYGNDSTPLLKYEYVMK